MIDAQLALELSNILHVLWAYCHIDTAYMDIYFEDKLWNSI